MQFQTGYPRLQPGTVSQDGAHLVIRTAAATTVRCSAVTHGADPPTPSQVAIGSGTGAPLVGTSETYRPTHYAALNTTGVGHTAHLRLWVTPLDAPRHWDVYCTTWAVDAFGDTVLLPQADVTATLVDLQLLNREPSLPPRPKPSRALLSPVPLVVVVRSSRPCHSSLSQPPSCPQRNPPTQPLSAVGCATCPGPGVYPFLLTVPQLVQYSVDTGSLAAFQTIDTDTGRPVAVFSTGVTSRALMMSYDITVRSYKTLVGRIDFEIARAYRCGRPSQPPA